jgi:hypothetical protein
MNRGQIIGRLIGTALALVLVLPASAGAANPLIQSFQAGVLNTLTPTTPTPKPSEYATQAGSHPAEAVTQFTVDTTHFDSLQDVRVDLPPGLSVNPQAVPQCTDTSSNLNCPANTQVGTSTVSILNINILGVPIGPVNQTVPVYNMAPPAGAPGDFAFAVGVTVLGITVTIRTDAVAGVRWYPSNGRPADYGEYFKISGISNTLGAQLATSTLTFWGAPEEQDIGAAPGSPADKAFLTNPTACNGPQTTYMYADTYTSGQTGNTTYVTPTGASGCAAVPFAPTVSVTPSTTQRDAPDGIAVDLQVPQDQNPAHLASSQLQNASITLPAGLTLNPSAGNGLQACADNQFNAGTNAAVTCPAASAVGTVEIDTPVLATPLTGSIYVGSPLPGNPYRVFLDAENASAGVAVRLVGSVSADPTTGRLTATFTNAPQLPFTDLKLNFAGGAKALFANPIACGTAVTNASLTPYSGNPFVSAATQFTVDKNGAGASCGSSVPFNASVSANLSNTVQSGHPNLTLNVARNDGDQTLSTVSVSLPPGLLANLSSATLCADPAATQGTCPAASAIGTAAITAGAGTSPLSLSGTVYLTGPYNGATFGLSIPVPAVAGPYNLGTVVVRAAVNVNTVTGTMTVTTDPLPTIVQGIPLRLKTIAVTINKANFLTNPTSCTPTSITGSLTSTAADLVPLSTALTMTGCASLAFAPTLTVTPSTTKADSPLGVTVDLQVPAGNSDLSSAVLTLPAGVTLNPSVANGLTACTDAQFGAGTNNPIGCPASSQIGTVSITSPLVATPLTGNIYVGQPSGTPYRIFVDAESSALGLSVRLGGYLDADPTTGRLTAHFPSTPPIPFTDFKLVFNGGATAPLASPAVCGTASTAASLTPVTGSVAAPTIAPFTVDVNGSGGGCPASTPFSPTLSVKPASTAAGAFDPLSLSFAGGDQEQRLASINATLPPGLLGNIGSVAECGDPAATQGTCGTASPNSDIGSVSVSAGVGPSPLVITGRVYLTGPYNGAPFGLSIVVPAVAGPFNLGTVVVRASIAVDPNDAHLTVVSGTFPSILAGIPLRLKGVTLTLDRPGFMFNPTSCAPATVSSTVGSDGGASVPVSAAFTPTGCTGLPFSPAVSATVSGGPGASTGAGLSVTVQPKSGQPNLASVSVKLPATLSARQSAVNGACPAATYAANPGACPASSRVGSASASTPVLPQPLTGTVYLVAQNGALPTLGLPLTAVGVGVSVNLSGTIAVGGDGLTTTFNSIPDVPLSSFTLSLPAGPSSALTSSAAYSCTTPPSLTGTFTAHSGASVTASQTLLVGGCAANTPGGGNTTTGAGGAGSSPSKWLQIGIMRIQHKRGHVLRIMLRLPAPGKIQLTSSSIHSVKAWTTKKSRNVWVTLKLTKYGVRHIRPHHKYKVKLRAGYKSNAGRSGWIWKYITFT